MNGLPSSDGRNDRIERGPWRLTTLALLSVLGFAAGLAFRPAGSLRAAGATGVTDLDGDGLCDAQEAVLGTSDLAIDSDNDSYSDLFEIIQGTDPALGASHPEGQISNVVGMCGYVADGELHCSTALYSVGQALSGVKFTFGVRLGGAFITLPPQLYTLNSSLHQHQIPGSPDPVYVLDFSLPAYPLQAFGSGSIYCLLTPAKGGSPLAAASLDLLQLDSVTLQIMPLSFNVTSGAGSSLYRPLSGPSSVPTSWTPGMICIQETALQGSYGGVVVQHVLSATCEPYDSYCPPDCVNLAGTDVEFVNPFGLVGG